MREEDTREGERLRKAKAPQMAAPGRPCLSYNLELFFLLRGLLLIFPTAGCGSRLRTSLLSLLLFSLPWLAIMVLIVYRALSSKQETLSLHHRTHFTACSPGQLLSLSWWFSDLHVAASHSMLRSRHLRFLGTGWDGETEGTSSSDSLSWALGASPSPPSAQCASASGHKLILVGFQAPFFF